MCWCTNFECREGEKVHKIIRQNNQKTREFTPGFQEQATKCNFDDKLHLQSRDRLISGINIPDLEWEFMQMPKSSFQDVRDALVNNEAVHNLTPILLSYPNPMLTHVHANNNLLRNRKAGHGDEHKFGKICPVANLT